MAPCGSAAPFKTLQHQTELPPLPVPSVHDSCELYLRSIRPLVDSEQDYEVVEKKAEDFARNLGPVLQERLLKYARERQAEGQSWLEQWWLDAAYLTFRAPLPTNSNYYLLFDPVVPEGERPDQLSQAMDIIHNTLQFKDVLEKEELRPEYLRRTTPQCMGQYEKIFGITRIALPDKDALIPVPANSKHIVVIYDEQLYSVTVLDGQGQRYNPYSIRKQLEKIVADGDAARHASRTQPIHPVGAITAIHRDHSATLRAQLGKQNQAALDVVDSALFALTLEKNTPRSVDEAGEWINGGKDDTPGNRWFEKAVNYVVFANGYAGLSGEHSPLDAPMVGTLANYVLERAKAGHKETTGPLQIPAFQKLEWNVDASLATELQTAKKEGWKALENCELNYLTFEEYGADWIKKIAKTSPDAYMQMSIQLAYYYLHRESTATYETGTSRCFFHGRTDTVRTLSLESKEWTESMVDESLSNEVKQEKLRMALEAHSAYMKRAIDGKVLDRHFLGLRLVKTPDEEMPDLFTDPVWRQSTRFRLSTSNMSSPHYKAGFGPTEEDGYGVCYDSRSDSLRYSITSFRSCSKTSTKEFASNLAKALEDMRSVFKQMDAFECVKVSR